MPRSLLACVSALALAGILPGPAAQGEEPKKPAKPAETTIDVRLTDDSTLKLILLEGQIEFLTPHGKLVIPVADIRQVELGLRIPDDVAAQIQAAAADLGSPQFKRREEATSVLLRHREKSYPALKQAARSADAEVAKRAEELIGKLEKLVPGGDLDLPEYDVIHTELSKIAGKIANPTLAARSFAFGDVQLKLSDVRAMSVGGFKEKEDVAVAVLPDPGSLTAYRQPDQVGKTFVFRVTGAAQGSLWGTETYTLDSTLAAAAVHMGVLKVGETGTVKVLILGPGNGYVGSTRNGLTSANFGAYPGSYQILLPDAKKGRGQPRGR
jgi:LCCL domain